jgi:tripartite-type tricarboxylate transporter receptor subunit TctC
MMGAAPAPGDGPTFPSMLAPRNWTRRRVLLAAAGCVGIAAAGARAQRTDGRERVAPVATTGGEPWPTRPIRIVVPQAAGGTADLVARVLAERLEAMLGVALVVDNRAGANGLIGTDAVRRAAPDGYTLLLASTATHVMAPHATSSGAFDPLRHFTPVINLAWQTKVALASAAVPATTLEGFVAYARARPGKLNYASTGLGSSSHLDAELLCAATGMKLVHIPYRGSGQTVAALTANEVQLLLASVTAAQGAVEMGYVRALAVFSPRRSPVMPRVPTIAEAGVPALDLRTWLGIVAPADTPSTIVAALNDAVSVLLQDPSMRQWLDAQGLEPIGGSPAAFVAAIRADVARWGEVVRRIGVTAR